MKARANRKEKRGEEKEKKKKKEEKKKRSARKAKVWNFVWNLFRMETLCKEFMEMVWKLYEIDV